MQCEISFVFLSAPLSLYLTLIFAWFRVSGLQSMTVFWYYISHSFQGWGCHCACTGPTAASKLSSTLHLRYDLACWHAAAAGCDCLILFFLISLFMLLYLLLTCLFCCFQMSNRLVIQSIRKHLVSHYIWPNKFSYNVKKGID